LRVAPVKLSGEPFLLQLPMNAPQGLLIPPLQ